MNFIQTLHFGQTRSVSKEKKKIIDNSVPKNIHLAVPNNSPRGNALTIIAGRNRTGKSHLLRHTGNALDAHNRSLPRPEYVKEMGASSSNVWVRPVDPTIPFENWLLINDVADMVTKFAIFPISPAAAKGHRINHVITSAKTEFLRRQFPKAPSLTGLFSEFDLRDTEGFWSEESIKAQMLDQLDPQMIYRADTVACPAIRTFESLASARIYLRRNKKLNGIELVLRYGPSEAFSFGGRTGGWSQGQKVAFCILLIVEYSRPSILLVDELENHLHPEYMTKVCEFIKERIPQTLIVTHHPHLIFSATANRVWFFDVEMSQDESPSIDAFPEKTSASRPPPRRRIYELSDDFERIEAAYSLFDNYDRALLTLATSLQEQVTTVLLKNIESGLTLDIASTSKSSRPDTQSQEIHNVVSSLFRNVEHRLEVLDYGAGKGRTVAELLKTSLFQRKRMAWTFYEPNENIAAELQSKYANNLPDCDLNISVCNVVQNLSESSFDVVLAANVLHECSPEQIVALLDTCRIALRPQGRVLIAELYPLLSPERFGIAYTEENMMKILRLCGFSGFTTSLPIRSGLARAYTTIGRPDTSGVQPSDGATRIREEVWEPIKREALDEYSHSLELVSARNAVKLASLLHVVASIDSYDAGHWPTI